MPGTLSSARALESYVREVALIIDQDLPVEESVKRIAAANQGILGSGFRLPEVLRTVHPTAPYTRNLVHADPRNRFAIIAILWGPFQETRVHDHLNWCVVNVLEGSCHAIDFARIDDERASCFADLEIRETKLIKAGTVASLLPPPRSNIHKMTNACRGVTISLHTYGDPGTKARVFDPASGRVEIVDLVFHNR